MDGSLPRLTWRRVATLSQIIDARLALTLRHHGVTEFATSNPKDFAGFGFSRVWNPLEEQTESKR